MQNIAAALALEHPETNKGSGVYVVPLADRVVRDMAPTLTVLAGAVALLLLIACVNLASLLLNRSASRAHEFGIRAAIGGSRWSLIRQLLIEHALLVGAGGVLGALAGAAILTGLVSVAPPDTPRLDEIRLDIVVLSCTTLFSCACAFLFGVLPALKASGAGGHGDGVAVGPRLDPAELAAAPQPADWGSGGRDGAALRIRTDGPHDAAAVARRSGLRSAQPADRHVLAGRAGLAGCAKAGVLRRSGRAASSGSRRRERRHHLFAPHPWLELVELVHGGRQAHPAGCRHDGPAQRGNRSGERDLLRNAEDPPHQGALVRPIRHARVSARCDHQYQPGQPVLAECAADAKARGPAFINADEDPIGQQIRLAGSRPTEGYGPWRTIVGIVGDVKQHGVDQDTPQQIFLPVVQQTRTTVFAVARTRGTVSSSSIETAIRDLDRSVPVFNDRTVEQVMREAGSRRRVAAIVLSVFAGAAVLLAAIGLYGVIAQSVSERRQEIGVRMALGATAGQILRLFLRHGLIVVAVGIGCGVVAAWPRPGASRASCSASP